LPFDGFLAFRVEPGDVVSSVQNAYPSIGEKEKSMPTYEYKCRDCKKKFTLIQSISDHGKTKVSCPKCKSTKVKKVISIFAAKTSKKS
jgi:putative FmdB family regulatory protein